MKIYYDYQIMYLQEYGGISRYFYNLITTIQNNGLADVGADCVFSRNKYFESFFGKKSLDEYSYLQVRTVNRLNQANTYLQLVKGCDIIHATYYNPYILKLKGKCKIVTTVHDMIYELFPECFPENDVTSENKRQHIYGADHIVAVSENTKKDILRLYPDIPAEKITVIYHGNSMKDSNLCARSKFPDRYILFVGTRWEYKNFDNFLEAVIPILNKEKDLHLVCFGGREFSEKELLMMGDLKTRIIQMSGDDDMLASAYSYALCFVFPSLYEGFGIPTLEAFSCDCPVLLSNTSSMPEVGGEAAMYFDPTNIDDIRKTISAVIYDEKLRDEMIIKGRSQLEKFSWYNNAIRHMDVYTKLML